MCLASLVCGAFVLLFFLGLKLRIWVVRVPKPQTLNEVSVLDEGFRDLGREFRVLGFGLQEYGAYKGVGFKSMGLRVEALVQRIM